MIIEFVLKHPSNKSGCVIQVEGEPSEGVTLAANLLGLIEGISELTIGVLTGQAQPTNVRLPDGTTMAFTDWVTGGKKGGR